MLAKILSFTTVSKGNCRASLIGAVVSCALVFVCLDTAKASTTWTPQEWQQGNPPKLRDSGYDRDGDFIDDRIPLSDPDNRVNVIFLFNQALSTDEIHMVLCSAVPQDQIHYIGRYVSVAAVKDIRVGDVRTLVAHPKVAFAQLDQIYTPTLDVSVRNIKVRASTDFSPSTVEDVFPTITGTGVNIAILDTGVDDTGHEMFAGRYAFGYDAYADVELNPSDIQGHGTHVAGIALGVQSSVGDYRGVAPGAGLVDIRVMTSDPAVCGSFPVCATDTSIMRGIDKVIQRKNTWNIRVMNMSFGPRVICGPPVLGVSNGTDATSTVVNTAVAKGVVAVASAGNDGPSNCGLGSPAAATLAITVASSDDMRTVNRGPNSVPPGDDQVANYSSRGPRQAPPINLNDLKPEITAPGSSIFSAQSGTTSGYIQLSGTSMASPHISGIAALIVQNAPTISPGDLKDLLIQTAEPQGTPTYPAVHPTWNLDWGYGLVEAFAASALTGLADLTFTNYPPPMSWLSPDVWANPNSTDTTGTHIDPTVGTPTYVHARVTNNGPNMVPAFRLRMGTYRFFTSGPERFYEIGVQVVTAPMAVGETRVIHIPWTPQSLAGAVEHACLKGAIEYGQDTNYTNNLAQRNIQIHTANTPAFFDFQVENDLVDPAVVILQVDGDNPNWDVDLTAREFVFYPGDCPRAETLALIPRQGTPEGDTVNVNVAALAIPFAGGDPVLLGGITAQAVKGPSNVGPAVFLRSPVNGTEVLPAGGTYEILWQSFDDTSVTRQEVRASLDGGRTFPVLVAPNLPGSATSLIWRVPAAFASVSARIRVTAFNTTGRSGSKDSNADFAIREAIPPEIGNVSPSGGEVFRIGETIPISWSSSDNVRVAAHHIKLSTDGGKTYSYIIATGLPGTTQSFNWAIPPGLVTERARIRVYACDPSGNESQSATNGTFAILTTGERKRTIRN